MLGGSAALATRLRSYGADRIPRSGGVVLAFNHFSWIDIPCVGWVCKRNLYFLAKVEAHGVPGLGQLIRSFGTLSVRRGESDREAVRLMREVVRNGDGLGVFVEGTRQRSGVPDRCSREPRWWRCRRTCRWSAARSTARRPGRSATSRPVSIAWGEPMRFDGLPRGGKGYREASQQIEDELHRLWVWLRDLHEAGRPRHAVPPRGTTPHRSRFRVTRRARRGRAARAAASAADRRGGDRRLPQRRQVDAHQPADRDARGRRARDAGRDARPQGARL